VVVGVTASAELGALRHIDDAKRASALGLVREGRLYDLGRELHEGIPVFPGRHFRQTLVPNPGPPLGDNRVDWTTEVVSATMQLGTHLDALCHLRDGEVGYDGWTLAETTPSGVTRLGIESVPQIVTRGWLVDVAPRGVGDVLTVADVEGIEPEPGDAVLFHTGWGERWDDPDAYLAGQPGPGLELAAWLVEHGVALTGCDTWSYGPVPAEDPARPFEVPQQLNVRHGVFIVENLDLSALAANGVRLFALVLTHPRLRGATGAWTSPIALV
jgi:kynurenine formamidase